MKLLSSDEAGKFNNGKKINVINQRLGYLVRSGVPDVLDSIVPMAYGNLALDLILNGIAGKLVTFQKDKYGNEDLKIVTSYKKLVNIAKCYNTNRLRPDYKSFNDKPFLIMTSDM